MVPAKQERALQAKNGVHQDSVFSVQETSYFYTLIICVKLRDIFCTMLLNSYLRTALTAVSSAFCLHWQYRCLSRCHC